MGDSADRRDADGVRGRHGQRPVVRRRQLQVLHIMLRHDQLRLL